MPASNLGRVQGGGFFGSSSTSTTSITKTTVQTNGVPPLIGDTIVNASGDLCKITAISDSEYTVAKYGSIKGAAGEKGTPGTDGKDGAPGADGKDGAPGADGVNGKDGFSIWPCSGNLAKSDTLIRADMISVPSGRTVQSKDLIISANGFLFQVKSRTTVLGVDTLSIAYLTSLGGEDALVTFNESTMTYEEWVQNCENGIYDSSAIGKTATVKNFVFGMDWTLRLIDVGHDVNHIDGSTINTTWEFTEIVCNTPLGLPFCHEDAVVFGQYHFFPSSAHGYGTAATLQTLLLSILLSMPPVVRKHIKLAKKLCYIPRAYRVAVDTDTSSTQSEGYKLFLLSGAEAGAGTSASFLPTSEGTSYSYYSDINSPIATTKRMKSTKGGSRGAYWLRSPDAETNDYFCYVSEMGAIDHGYTSAENTGIAPAFCI